MKNDLLYQDGYKYRLESEAVFHLSIWYNRPADDWTIDAGLCRVEFGSDETRLIIHRGFCWDGATGTVDTKEIMVPALIHDALYACLRHAHEILLDNVDVLDDLRHYADLVFLEKCIDYGVPKWQAGLFHAAVALFGHKAASKPREFKFLEIPK